MHSFFETFPWYNKIKEGLPQVFDLAMTMPSISCQSSENIFFSSLLAICQMKNIIFGEIQKKIVESRIPDRKRVADLQRIIVMAY